MPFHSHPLIRPQQHALAAAAGLVGRPRLHAGLALLTVACGPMHEHGDSDHPDTMVTATGATGDSSTHDTGAEDGTCVGETLISDAGTTFGPTGETGSTSSGETGSSSGDDTGSSSGDATGSSSGDDTDGLEDCIDPRTMEVNWACCEAQNWLPSPQCTPWGPPPPPAAGRLQRARAARRLA